MFAIKIRIEGGQGRGAENYLQFEDGHSQSYLNMYAMYPRLLNRSGIV